MRGSHPQTENGIDKGSASVPKRTVGFGKGLLYNVRMIEYTISQDLTSLIQTEDNDRRRCNALEKDMKILNESMQHHQKAGKRQKQLMKRLWKYLTGDDTCLVSHVVA